jgi:hypothetical protein
LGSAKLVIDTEVLTLRLRTWCHHPAGMNSACPGDNVTVSRGTCAMYGVRDRSGRSASMNE